MSDPYNVAYHPLLINVKHDGKTYAGWTRDALIAAGVPLDVINAAAGPAEEASPTPAIPDLDDVQFRMALSSLGEYAKVNTWVAEHGTEAQQIWWDRTIVIKRNDTTLAAIATANELDLDLVWEAAA